MESAHRRAGAALCAILLVSFLWMVKGLAIPIALGGLLALMLAPLQRRVARALGNRSGLAPALLTAGALLLVVIPFALAVAQVIVSINDFLARGVPEILDEIQRLRSTRLAWLAEHLPLDDDAIRQHFGTLLKHSGLVFAGLAGSFAQALPGRLVGMFLFTLALYYFLRDGRTFTRFLAALSPFADADTERLFASIERAVRGVLLGQLVTPGVQGGLTIGALLLFSVPGALVFGLVAMLLSVIPMVGTTPVTVGAVLYLVASARYGAAVGMAVAALMIGISDNVVRPLVQSSQSRLHPLLVLVSIFGGVEVFGAAGVLIGPVLAVLAVWALDMLRAPRAGVSPSS